jgi:hypothetical protein
MKCRLQRTGRVNDSIRQNVLRLWRSAEIVCVVVAGVTWIAWLWLVQHWKKESPSLPNPATGETVAVHWRSAVIYMTPQEARLDSWLTWSGVVALAVFGAFALWRRYIARHQKSE